MVAAVAILQVQRVRLAGTAAVQVRVAAARARGTEMSVRPLVFTQYSESTSSIARIMGGSGFRVAAAERLSQGEL